MVDHLVMMSETNESVWEHYAQDRPRRKSLQVDERWVETVLTRVVRNNSVRHDNCKRNCCDLT
jgi:hypothetical protein